MSTYILGIRDDISTAKVSTLGNKFRCFVKVVKASSIKNARAMAAEDAESMGEFDNPKAWLKSCFSFCQNANSEMVDSGVICAER